MIFLFSKKATTSFTSGKSGAGSKLSTFEKLHTNATIERELCLSDVTAAMIRLAFARSCQYFRGFRSLERQAVLLRSSDRPIFEIALELSKRKSVKNLMGKIEKLL